MDDEEVFALMEFEVAEDNMFCIGCGETVTHVAGQMLAEIVAAARAHQCVGAMATEVIN